MSDREEAKKKAETLKRLREEHKESVTRVQAQMKEQNAIRKIIREAMGDEPKTVLQVAEATGMAANEVLWHINAMRKYGQVLESDMDGEYYTYQIAQESPK
jgi:predicted transcriptional regulator